MIKIFIFCLFLPSCMCVDKDINISSSLKGNNCFFLEKSLYVTRNKNSNSSLSPYALVNMSPQYHIKRYDESYFIPKGTQIYVKQLYISMTATYAAIIPVCYQKYSIVALIKIPSIKYDVLIGIGPKPLDAHPYYTYFKHPVDKVQSFMLRNCETHKPASFDVK